MQDQIRQVVEYSTIALWIALSLVALGCEGAPSEARPAELSELTGGTVSTALPLANDYWSSESEGDFDSYGYGGDDGYGSYSGYDEYEDYGGDDGYGSYSGYDEYEDYGGDDGYEGYSDDDSAWTDADFVNRNAAVSYNGCDTDPVVIAGFASVLKDGARNFYSIEIDDITSCNQRGHCCDDHDDCYRKNHCTMESWRTSPEPNLIEGLACDECNVKILQCASFGSAPGGPSACKDAGTCSYPQLCQ